MEKNQSTIQERPTHSITEGFFGASSAHREERIINTQRQLPDLIMKTFTLLMSADQQSWKRYLAQGDQFTKGNLILKMHGMTAVIYIKNWETLNNIDSWALSEKDLDAQDNVKFATINIADIETIDSIRFHIMTGPIRVSYDTLTNLIMFINEKSPMHINNIYLPDTEFARMDTMCIYGNNSDDYNVYGTSTLLNSIKNAPVFHISTGNCFKENDHLKILLEFSQFQDAQELRNYLNILPQKIVNDHYPNGELKYKIVANRQVTLSDGRKISNGEPLN